MAITAGKVSVAFFILRILGVASIWKRRLLQFVIYSVSLCATTEIILTFTQCVPTRALWTPSVALHAKCFSPTILTVFALVFASKLPLMSQRTAAEEERLLYPDRSALGPFAYFYNQESSNEREQEDRIEWHHGSGSVVSLS